MRTDATVRDSVDRNRSSGDPDRDFINMRCTYRGRNTVQWSGIEGPDHISNSDRMSSAFEIEFAQSIDVKRALDAAGIKYVAIDRRRAFVIRDRGVLGLECETGTLSSVLRVAGSAITTRTVRPETALEVTRRIREVLAEYSRSE